METKLCTIGYEGRSLEAFIDILMENGINLLADIRAVPYSRKREFSRKALERNLKESGIEYVHFDSLGSPKDLRDKVRADNDYDYFFVEYEIYLMTRRSALTELLDLIRDKTVCLLCYEKDVDRCHRRTVADKIRSIACKDIELLHL